jgi:ABC-type multidrug transport system ATPase subunit
MDKITVKNISKSFGNTKALDNINLNVKEGELFGMIGPDGAGKTTLIRILLTLLLPDNGEAIVNGLDIIDDYKKIRSTVGYMPGRFSLYSDLTVEENMELFAKIFGTTIKENYYLVKDIYSQIEPFKDRQAGKLSGGMKQKLALSCALIHKPDVLFLDEPTTGVDPVSRKELWDMLKKLKEQGITIFVTTAYMDEAKLCDRVALINKGKLLSVDPIPDIISRFGSILYAIEGYNNYKFIEELKNFELTDRVYPFGEVIHLIIKGDEERTDEIVNFLNAKGYGDFSINRIEPDIEDCFINFMVQDEQE